MKKGSSIWKSFLIAATLVALGHYVSMGQIKLDVEDVACAGQANGKITASITSGISGDFEYSKDGKAFQSSNVFSNLSPGSYNITIRDKSTMCMYSKSASVKGGVGLAVDIQGGGTFTFCDTEGPPTITLTATASRGEKPYTFEGWPGGKKEVRSTQGTQTLNVKDKNNCSGSADWSVQIIRIVCSRDPNDMIGPDGYGDPKFVSAHDRLPYKIRFENDPEFASAPAQKVVIEHILDMDLNLFSVNLSNFGFANFVFEVPKKSTFYKKRLDVRDSLGIFVDVTAGIDVTENKVFWIFESVDSKTGLGPSDPQLGMLPVNDTLTKKGEGFVDFSVVPKASSATGDSIIAEAAIVFDVNETINTPKIYNVIDALPPTSRMSTLPEISDELTILLSWTAQDDPGGSGVKDYAVFVSENYNDYYPYQTGIQDSFLVFAGSPGSHYSFYIVSTDNVGNVEQKSAAETSTSINPEAQLSIIALNQNNYCVGDSLGIQWAAAGIQSVDILFSEDRGQSYETLFENVTAENGVIKWLIPADFTPCTDCRIKVRDAAAESTITDEISVAIFGIPSIEVSGDIHICGGDFVQLEVNDFEKILWTPSIGLSSNTIQRPYASPDETTTYTVRGTDVYGCENSTSLTVTVAPVALTEIRGTACTPQQAGVFVDTLTNQFDCDSIVIKSLTLDNVAPVINCVPTLDITIPQTGQYELMTELIDPLISDDCGIANVTLSQSSYSCVDVGVKELEMKVTDLAGNISSCTVDLNILPSNICSIVMSNKGGNDIPAPCSCLGNGAFEEEITITSLPGESWIVSNTSLADPISGEMIPAGKAFVENPLGSGLYRLKGVHYSGEGYTITAESPNYKDFTITFNNTCYYPQASILGVEDLYCIESPVFELQANVNNASGNGTFRVDGTVFDFFEAATIGMGKHTLTYQFDAGTASPNDSTDPGCIIEVSQGFEIMGKNHPICMGDGPFFTFSYSGPDTFFVNENCLVDFDLGESPAFVEADYLPEQSIISFGLSTELTGIELGSAWQPGTVIPVTFIAEDNFTNKDTFIVLVPVVDTIAPTALCRDLEITLSETGLASITFDSVNEDSYDACGIASINLSQIDFDPKDIGVVPITMIVADLNGNTANCTSMVTVKDFSTSTLDLPQYVDAAQIYPNPTPEKVTIELELNEPVVLYVELFSPHGALIYHYAEEKAVAVKYIKEIDLKSFPAGQYILKISDADGRSFSSGLVKTP